MNKQTNEDFDEGIDFRFTFWMYIGFTLATIGILSGVTLFIYSLIK